MKVHIFPSTCHSFFRHMSATRCYSPSEVEDQLKGEAAKGKSVMLDFAGEYIPVKGPSQTQLASQLVCAYHNNLVRTNIGDDTYEPYREEGEVCEGEEGRCARGRRGGAKRWQVRTSGSLWSTARSRSEARKE